MAHRIVLNEENISSVIYFIRGKRVMLDSDLAQIYGVQTKRLIEQVKRNIRRFPEDFMFQLAEEEWQDLRSQFATANMAKRRSLPYVFTEHGAIMLASVLSSEQAIQASVYVVRAFYKMRELLYLYDNLAKQIEGLESRYNKNFSILFAAIKKLTQQSNKPRNPIGY